jgi:hypothetical protein
MTYKGSCHCGKVAFEADGEIQEVLDCNCSICSKRGYLHWFLPHDKVRFETPASNLATYTFKSGKYKHQFCRDCGVGPFVVGDQGIAVNVRCLDGVDPSKFKVNTFDGKRL